MVAATAQVKSACLRQHCSDIGSSSNGPGRQQQWDEANVHVQHVKQHLSFFMCACPKSCS